MASRAHYIRERPRERVPMLKVKRIAHVAVCVADVDAAGAVWASVFGLRPGEPELVSSQATVAMTMAVGESCVEFIAPAGNPSLARFLEKRGPGLHHIAIEVEGIDQAVAALKGLGVALIDDTPRLGAHGHKVVFVHPKATGGVLIELVEAVSKE